MGVQRECLLAIPPHIGIHCYTLAGVQDVERPQGRPGEAPRAEARQAVGGESRLRGWLAE